MHARNRTWALGSDPVERCRQRTLPVEGGDGSTLSLDFTTGVLDPRLTFTRSTDATFINSSGYVQLADANHVRNSTMLVGTLWTATTTGTGAITINGDNSVRLNGSGGRATWLQSLTLANGLTTSFSFRVTSFTNNNLRTTDLFNSGFGFTSQEYFYTDTNGTTYGLSAFELLPKSGTNGLGVYTCVATTTGTTCNIIFGADCNSLGNRFGDVTVKDPQVQYGRVIPYRVYVPNSSTASAKWDSARFDYDPTSIGTPRGLLIEGSANNLALRSNDFNSTLTDGTQWSASGYTVGTLSTTLPDGTTGNACRISGTGSGSFRSATITVSVNTAYTFSFWARNNGGSQARFRVWNVTAGSSIVDYTQSANNYVSQIGGANNTSSTWVRVQVQFNTPVGCTSIWVYPTSSDTGTIDLLVWGAQVELGSGASSYIPTGASTGNRAADNCYLTDWSAFSPNWNTAAGTMLVDADVTRISTAAAFPRPFTFTTTTNSGSRFGMFFDCASNVYKAETYLQTYYLEQTASITSNGTRFVHAISAFRDTQSRLRGALNGSTITAVSDSPNLGLSSVGGFALNMGTNASCPSTRVRKIKYWPREFSQSELNNISIT